MATTLKRVTEDRVSVALLGYDFPHSIVDSGEGARSS
jgi:hypothetical protein